MLSKRFVVSALFADAERLVENVNYSLNRRYIAVTFLSFIVNFYFLSYIRVYFPTGVFNEIGCFAKISWSKILRSILFACFIYTYISF